MSRPLPRLRLSSLLALAVAVLALPAATASAKVTPHAHASGALGVKGWSEAKMRAYETIMLGPEHAAEHASIRRVARMPGAAARERRQAKAARLKAKSAAVVPTNVGGRWNGRFDIPVMGINAAVLPTGKVLWYAYPNEPDSAPRRNEAWGVLWDPTKGTGATAFKRVDPPIDPATGKPANIWCGGTSFLADGRVLVTGGNLSYVDSATDRYAGLKHVYTFNPFNETWTRQPDMAHGRWYPSQMLLPDGRTIIIQGLDENSGGVKNQDVEVFTPSADLDGRGTITKLGTLPNAFTGDYYPHTFWMPSGRGLIAGPFTEDSFFLANPGTSNTFSISDAANPSRRRVWGNGVLVPGGTAGTTKVMQLGGSDTTADYNNAFATATSETYDEATNKWTASPAQKVGRSHANTVLLPDGSMVTVGGGVGNDSTKNRLWTGTTDQLQVELWDPVAKTWSLGPSQLETRAYHSTAVLLPDGRVISAGDDRNGGFDRDSAEIYEPPYLFKGARPTLTKAPTEVSFGATFTVDTPDTDVTKAVLVAPAAATHAVDMNQRYVPLVQATRTGGLTLTAPRDGNVAPPGYYMLFLVNSKGVPSVAKWVRLKGGTVAPPAGTAVEKAAGRPTSASSFEGAGFEPDKAVDGNLGTRWSSSFADGQWWQVDLGSARQVNSVALTFNQWAWPRTYRISTSTDGVNFTAVADETLTAYGTRTSAFSARSARYVRVTGLTRATSAGTSIEEAKVYGPDDASTPPTPPPPDGELFEKGFGQPAIASSYEGPGYEPNKANDGSLDTRWSSTFADNQWWQVDLGATRTVSQVIVAFNQWAWPRTFQVLTSTDAATWSTASTQTMTNYGSRSVSFTARGARYVRIVGVTRATSAGTSIEEAKILGPQDSATAPPPPPPPAATVEKAAGQPTSTSSFEGPGYEAPRAVDGNPDSRWSSTFADNQWWQVDLGRARSVSSFSLRWNMWAWPKRYTIATSTDGTTFTTVVDTTQTTYGTRTHAVTPVTARYVRVTGLTRGTSAGTSIEEAQVFGPDD